MESSWATNRFDLTLREVHACGLGLICSWNIYTRMTIGSHSHGLFDLIQVFRIVTDCIFLQVYSR